MVYSLDRSLARSVPCHYAAQRDLCCTIRSKRTPSFRTVHDTDRKAFFWEWNQTFLRLQGCCRSTKFSSRSSRAISATAEQMCLQGNSMEDIHRCLLERLLEASRKLRPSEKYLVGIAGAPGSGKSTLAQTMCDALNSLQPPVLAVNVPMDGFHYYRRELDQMDDPREAHARRGAHWTFNSRAFVDCLRKIRKEGEVLAPSFSHGTGDPVENDIVVSQEHQVVIVEGNYLLLDLQPWTEVVDIFDETWYIDCDVDVAMERVLERMSKDMRKTLEEAKIRIATNDRPNALQIAATHSRANIVIPSLPMTP